MNLEYYIVDVFAEQKYQGNQLAVFPDAGDLTKETMQLIARETNFAETTFIVSGKPASRGFPVRIFTPKAEIPFAGHPTLGTAYIIQQFLLKKEVEQLILELALGGIPVSFKYQEGHPSELWMKQSQPQFGNILQAAEVAPILGIPETAIRKHYPIQEVSTGLPYFIVPVGSLKDMQSLRIQAEPYQKFIEAHQSTIPVNPKLTVSSTAFFPFSTEVVHTHNHIHARMFDDAYGIPEDAATGSANGCLLAYLLRHQCFGDKALDLRVEQGIEMGRPSTILLRGQRLSDGEMEILVGGQVQLISRGIWYL